MFDATRVMFSFPVYRRSCGRERKKEKKGKEKKRKKNRKDDLTLPLCAIHPFLTLREVRCPLARRPLPSMVSLGSWWILSPSLQEWFFCLRSYKSISSALRVRVRLPYVVQKGRDSVYRYVPMNRTESSALVNLLERINQKREKSTRREGNGVAMASLCACGAWCAVWCMRVCVCACMCVYTWGGEEHRNACCVSRMLRVVVLRVMWCGWVEVLLWCV